MQVTDLDLAFLAKAAYPGPRPDVLRQFDIVVEFFDKKTDTEAFLAVDASRELAVLSFRGTEIGTKGFWKDLWTDLKAIKKKYQGERIHKGFLKAYLSIQEQIDIETSKLPEEYCLYITGHSLGGALACLAGLYGKMPSIRLVTFGQPRIGGKNTADALTMLNYTRYVNHADAVARIPRLNYYHGGELLYLNKAGKLMVNPSASFMFKDRFWNFFHRFDDHSIDEYIKRGIIK